MSDIVITVDRHSSGQLQVAICDDEAGHGFRIAGPKYDGRGMTLLKHKLSLHDVEEIMSYLRKVNECE